MSGWNLKVILRVSMEPQAHLEEDGDGRNLLGVSLEAMAQVAAMGQVQAHDAVVGRQQRSVHLQWHALTSGSLSAMAEPR